MLRKHGIELTAEESGHFHRLALLTGYVEEQEMRSSHFTHYRITPKGLDMMLAYGGFRNYVEYQKNKYQSERWMQRLVIAVALATIVNCLFPLFTD